MVDPGIGFGKTLDHNLALLAHLQVVAGGRPLLLGASRKRFIGGLTGAAVDDRLPGSLAALHCCLAGRGHRGARSRRGRVSPVPRVPGGHR